MHPVPPLIYTPKVKVAALVHNLVTTIGVTRGPGVRLAFTLGPISFDHTDAEARQFIADGFAIALAENIAVGFHLDDAMYWSNRSDLYSDPANVEWTDYAGTPSTALYVNWAHPPARMCYNAPRIQAEVTRRARDVIGAEIVAQWAILKAKGKEDLFAGVIAGWESHMGQEAATQSRLGFHALANRGFSANHPPANLNTEIASIVAEHLGRWTAGLTQAGVDPAHIYTHVNFLTKADFATYTVPPDVTYELMVNSLPSTQQPSVAFTANSRPGFSTYPVLGTFDQIQEERALHSQIAWASSEGTNLIPPGPVGNTGMTMETYLARCYNNGAMLVNVYGWGIGGPAEKDSNPYRVVVEGADSIATYRKFLRGDPIAVFVDRFYRLVLQREPDAGGLAYWVNNMHSGTLDGASLARGFVLSPEFTGRNLSDLEFIDVLYAAIFDRTGDSGGIAYWSGQLSSGVLREDVLWGFLDSAEFASLSANAGIVAMSDSTRQVLQVRRFVRRFYVQFLQREGDAGGIAYWTENLINGSLIGSSLAHNFFLSQEFIDRGLSNAQYVDILYATFFSRASDPDGQAFWLGQLGSSTRLQVLDGFIYSQEFLDLCAAYGISAYITVG